MGNGYRTRIGIRNMTMGMIRKIMRKVMEMRKKKEIIMHMGISMEVGIMRMRIRKIAGVMGGMMME